AYPPSRLFVNDRLDVALATGAAGVQLGWGSLLPEDARRLDPEWWIGKSVHDLAEAEAARTQGADYLLVGPVFATPATPTHPERPPLGPAALGAIARLGVPVVAIGGITPARAGEGQAAGTCGWRRATPSSWCTSWEAGEHDDRGRAGAGRSADDRRAHVPVAPSRGNGEIPRQRHHGAGDRGLGRRNRHRRRAPREPRPYEG